MEKKVDVLIISGLPGSGKGALTHMLAGRLGWKYLSIGDLWREKHIQYIRQNPDKKISFHEYWAGLSLKEQEDMDGRVREIIKKGNVVCDFRYTRLAEGLPAFRVFVTASLPIRAERAGRTGRYPQKNTDEIKSILKRREEDELNTAKLLYGKEYDFREEGQYDLIIDSSNVSVQEEAEQILGLLNQ